MSLDLWRLKEFVSIHQACCLALGINPDKYDVDDNALFDIDGYRPLREILDNGLYEHISNESGSGFYFNNETILKTESPDGNYSFELSLVLVKRLLRRESIASSFYDQIKDPQSEKSPKIKNLDVERELKPKYSTRYMDILYKTIERYYSDQFDPNIPDSHASQVHIVNWLKEEYDLLQSQAERIDRILRYSEGNKPLR